MATDLSVHTRNRLIAALTSQRAASEIRNILEVVNPAVGNIWYVDSVSGNDGNDGKTSARALATLDAIFAKVTETNGDVVFVLPGHTETITTVITVDKAGVTIIGLGQGTARPSFTGNVADDTMTITAANVVIHNLLFNEATAVTGAAINVAAADVLISGCQFDLGVNDKEAITVETAGDNCTIDGCDFKVTNNGPDAAIELEGTSSDLEVANCLFDGGTNANAWDAAAINSTTAVTGVKIEDNDFRFVKSSQEYITLSGATEQPVIKDNSYVAGASLLTQLNGPTTFYVQGSGGGSDVAGAGLSRKTPTASIDYAVGLCSANAGDKIIVMPGHVATISDATSLVVDVVGIEIIGEGSGSGRPTLTMDSTGSNVPISGNNCTLRNFLIVTSGTVDVTAGITVTGRDCLLQDIEFRELAATSQIVDGIVVATGGDRCRIVNFKYFGAAGDAGAAAISITAALSFVEIIKPRIVGTHSAGCIENVSAACTDLLIQDAIIEQRHSTMDAGITIVTTATGHIINPWIRTATDDVGGFDAAITAGNDMQIFNPLIVNADGEVGAAWGTASNNT